MYFLALFFDPVTLGSHLHSTIASHDIEKKGLPYRARRAPRWL